MNLQVFFFFGGGVSVLCVFGTGQRSVELFFPLGILFFVE